APSCARCLLTRGFALSRRRSSPPGTLGGQSATLRQKKIAVDELRQILDVGASDACPCKMRFPLVTHAGDPRRLGPGLAGRYSKKRRLGTRVIDGRIGSVAAHAHLLGAQPLSGGQHVEGGSEH